MSFLTTMKLSLRRFNYRLYLTLLLRLLFPTLYQTFRVSLLGALPNTNALSIASQMQWVGVLLEIVEEALFQPLYFCIGSTLSDKSATKNKVKTSAVVSGLTYLPLSLILIALAGPLVSLMAQNPDLHDETVSYIRLELVGVAAESLNKMLMVVMILHEWNAMLYLALTVQMMASVSLDYALVSPKALDLGTTGMAVSSIVRNVTVLTVCFLIVWKKLGLRWRSDLSGPDAARFEFGWLRDWRNVGAFSGLDSLIRNVVYMAVFLRTMNMLESQDVYWIANTFVWSWLLLPAIPLADLLKQDVSSGLTQPIPYLRKTVAYLLASLAIFVVWASTYPAWPAFLQYVLRAPDPDAVLVLLNRLVPGYVFYVLGSFIVAIFYAVGRTELLAIRSFIGNTVIGGMYLAMQTGLIASTVLVLATIFAMSNVVSLVVLAPMCVWLVRKSHTL